MNAVVNFYLPLALKNPPDAIIGQSLSQEPGDDDVRKWLQSILDRAFPKAEELIRKMTLDVNFKDVTFETLNQKDFLKQIKKEFPNVNWEKAYMDFRAAGEKKRPASMDENNPKKQ
jgi:disulfide oxidoreductase YuzD